MPQELKRELGLKEVVATVMTSVIGGGLFLTTVQIQNKVLVGSNVIFSYMIAALPAFFIALCYAVLSSTIPGSGGDYLYISRILDPYLGFVTTWVRWFGMVASIAAISIGDLELINNMFYALGWNSAANFVVANRTVIAIAIVLTFLTINYLGVKIYGWVQDIMFVILLSGIVLLIALGLPHVSISTLASSARGSYMDIMSASSIIFFSYIGFAAIADAGGEVKNPKKNLPKGIVISVLAISAIYILVATVTYGSTDLNTVISEGNVPAIAMLFLPSIVALYISFTAFIALVSDINPSILATSRLTFAWAKDNVVPKKLSALSKYHTPKWTLLMNGAIAIFIILAFQEFIEAIDITTIAILLTYALVAITAFVLPIKRPDLWEKTEVKYRGTWLIALAGMMSTLLLLGLIIKESIVQFTVVVLWIAVGSAVYYLTLTKHQLNWRMAREARKGLEELEKKMIEKLK